METNVLVGDDVSSCARIRMVCLGAQLLCYAATE